MRRYLHRWLRQSTPLLKQGGVILLYHRITDLVRDPLLLSVSPTRFADHLAALSTVGRIVSLRELLAHPRPHTIAITFDDGYADNYHHALPILRQFDAQATFYITTGLINTNLNFWWDDLVELLLGETALPTELELNIPKRPIRFKLASTEPWDSGMCWTILSKRDVHPRQRAFRRIFQILKTLPSQERDTLLTNLFSQAGARRLQQPENRPMTVDELRSLAHDPHVSIGTHTVTHARLASLPYAAQRDELGASCAHLASIVGTTVDSLAYPYGGMDDFNQDSVRLAKELGINYACVAVPGAVTSATTPWTIPRFHVRNWTETELLNALHNFPNI